MVYFFFYFQVRLCFQADVFEENNFKTSEVRLFLNFSKKKKVFFTIKMVFVLTPWWRHTCNWGTPCTVWSDAKIHKPFADDVVFFTGTVTALRRRRKYLLKVSRMPKLQGCWYLRGGRLSNFPLDPNFFTSFSWCWSAMYLFLVSHLILRSLCGLLCSPSLEWCSSSVKLKLIENTLR
jgi:hypothetical protein